MKKIILLILGILAIFYVVTTFANTCPNSIVWGTFINAAFSPTTNNPPGGKDVTSCGYYSSDHGMHSIFFQHTKVILGQGKWVERGSGWPKDFLICDSKNPLHCPYINK